MVFSPEEEIYDVIWTSSPYASRLTFCDKKNPLCPMRHALCAWRGSEPQPLSVETTVLPVTPQPHNFVKKENKSDPFFPRPLPPTPIPLTLKLRRRIRLGKMLTQKWSQEVKLT